MSDQRTSQPNQLHVRAEHLQTYDARWELYKTRVDLSPNDDSRWLQEFPLDVDVSNIRRQMKDKCIIKHCHVHL